MEEGCNGGSLVQSRVGLVRTVGPKGLVRRGLLILGGLVCLARSVNPSGFVMQDKACWSPRRFICLTRLVGSKGLVSQTKCSDGSTRELTVMLLQDSQRERSGQYVQLGLFGPKGLVIQTRLVWSLRISICLTRIVGPEVLVSQTRCCCKWFQYCYTNDC